MEMSATRAFSIAALAVASVVALKARRKSLLCVDDQKALPNPETKSNAQSINEKNFQKTAAPNRSSIPEANVVSPKSEVIEAPKKKRPRFVFVTGSSGSGKTSLSKGLKRENDFIHFDVDMWTNGGDPINNAGEAPMAEYTKNLTPEIQNAIRTIVQKVYMNLWSNRAPDPKGWEKFYDLVLGVYMKRKKELEGRHIIFDHAVYVRENRDYIRKILGDDLVFLLLDTSGELLYNRIEARTTNQAKSAGMSLKEWVKSWNNGHTVESVKAMWRRNITGFQPMHPDEPNTFQITITEDVSIRDVLKWAQDILDL